MIKRTFETPEAKLYYKELVKQIKKTVSGNTIKEVNYEYADPDKNGDNKIKSLTVVFVTD